jgi:hypothetical protein
MNAGAWLLLFLPGQTPVFFDGNVLELTGRFEAARVENALPRRGLRPPVAPRGGACELAARAGIAVAPVEGPEGTSVVWRVALPPLPDGEALRFRFGCGIEGGLECPDGVRFSVLVDGAERFARTWGRIRRAAWDPGETAWLDGEADLSPDAGRTILLALRAQSGPTATGDAAVWGAPRIVRLRRARGAWGPLPEPRLERFAPDQAAPVAGRALRLRAALRNAGDGAFEPEPDACFRLTVPDGVRLLGEAALAIPPLEPGASATLEWPLVCERAGAFEAVLDGPVPGRTRFSAAAPDGPAATVAGDGLSARAAADRVEWLDAGGRVVARSAPVTRLVLGSGGDDAGETLAFGGLASRRDGPALELSGARLDSRGVLWHLRVRLEPAGAGTLRWTQTLVPDGDRDVLLWEGLPLSVGDGDPDGARKDAAVFPGLEYLEADEPSSSDRFVAFPWHLRHTPHPRMVTAPLMAVARAGTMTGLAWDPRSGAQPTFASPDFLDGRESHRLALSWPPVDGAHRDENALRARVPVRWPRGLERRLAGEVFVHPGREPAAAVLHWLARHGVPPPSRPVRHALPEIRRSLAFLDARRDPGGAGWKPHDLRGPIRLRVSAANEALAAGLLGEPERVERLRSARAAMDRVLAGRALDEPALEWTLNQNAHFLLGGLQLATLVWGRGVPPDDPAHAFAFRREPRFFFEKWRPLGREGEEAPGLGASAALEQLVRARLTGDPGSARAGLEALEQVERFRRPCGAQSWEIPVGAPDLLTVAFAARAHLEAHALTGERAHLERARAWAERGLPFIYLWGEPGVRGIPGGAVPALAGSFYVTGVWFGVSVPWVGLAYARTALRLARALDDPFWERIAESLVAGAADVQETEGFFEGGLPDGFIVVDQLPNCPPLYPPDQLLSLLLAFAGRDADLPTALVEGHGLRVRATSGAGPVSARWDGDRLLVGLPPSPDLPSQTLLAGLPRPGAVRARGRALPEAPDLDAVPEGWCWFAPFQALYVKLPPATAPVTVEVSGR